MEQKLRFAAAIFISVLTDVGRLRQILHFLIMVKPRYTVEILWLGWNRHFLESNKKNCP